MKLNELRGAPGARSARKRVGRGIGSGMGKTCGRGHKGAKARKSNPKPPWFEGGQMPLYRRLPKRGFNNPFRREYAILNLDQLQAAVDKGKIAPGSRLDAEKLVEAGVIRRARDGVRLLGRGELTVALELEVAHASKKAIEAVEKAGGRVILPAGGAAGG
ncbi:MAG: 50S ribosomal protein L15 [Geminicoccaceae bacterium]|nr:50S ribosomal protein L15 [Geminicoccaceae bacterium]MCS7267224.1 50S ribosomal protein L15 [Geminicoccaceae bacterium]MDW8123996.1 50S ribosomal protein L15 [Geminicoccaceae bacterium]MDW8340711.1 50S ribosomal protein L15 [Geminicoccaceae bacterium]